ncbi:MAG: hypothetical protein HDR28_06225 [Lachnospiraceae bacterium]|nr:hypothetical protein [Lachnospiraceae bacterium]
MTKDVNGKPLCNFTLKVLGVDVVRFDGIGKRIHRVKVCFDFGEKVEEDTNIQNIPLAEIDNTHWKDLDIRCSYYPEISESKVERYLSNIIRKQLQKAPKRQVEHLTHAGMHRIGGQPIFCIGKEVIPDHVKNKDYVIEIAALKENLDIDDNLAEYVAVKEMFDFISLSPKAGQVLLAYKLGCFMRMAYEDVGKTPKSCIYLYGDTGIQKTTFSSLMVQTYNRSKGIKNPSRLNASIPAAVQILKEKAGDVAILDDLFPANSSKVRSQMEETLIEIVRYIADGTLPAKKYGNKLSQEEPKCGVVFNAEYIIGEGSDAARILPVEMVKPDIKRLEYFQNHPLIISTFYYYYISWFVEHYDEICEIIKKSWKTYENAYMGVHDRLREMHFFLKTAYFLFLQYCFEHKLLSQSDAIRLYQSFKTLLDQLVTEQNERVQMGAPKQFENKDYWKIIRELYRNKQFCTADSANNFVEWQHDSVIHRDCLYFRGECLAKFFPNISPQEIASELKRKGVLQAGKDANTKQISILRGLRFYVIPLQYLT